MAGMRPVVAVGMYLRVADAGMCLFWVVDMRLLAAVVRLLGGVCRLAGDMRLLVGVCCHFDFPYIPFLSYLHRY